MNRRKFFGAVTAVVAAACVPGAAKAVSLHNVKIQFPRLMKGPGHMLRYSSGLQKFKLYAYQLDALRLMNFGDLAEIEARVISTYRSKAS